MKNIKNNRFIKYTLIAFYLVIISSFIIPFKKYVIYLPGGLSAVGDEITIDNSNNYNEFYSIYIIAKDKPTFFQLLTSSLNKKTDIYKLEAYDKDSFQRGQILEELSYQRSLIVAYNKASELDNEISINYYKKGYVITSSTNNNLKLGDIITSIDQIEITEFSDQSIIEYLKNNDTVSLSLVRENKDLNTKIVKNEEGLFGISFESYYIITNATPNYQTFYDKDLKGGPSGGLIQTLLIYNELLGNKYNKIIAGTGTMLIDGTVGPIGGIKQKIYTAQNKADIFLCPQQHYQEALKVYKTIKNPSFVLLEVKDFEQAITILSNYK